MIINSTDPSAHGRAYFGKGQGDIYLMFNAMEVRVILKSVHPVMLESVVKLCVWISIIIREKHMGIYVHVFT